MLRININNDCNLTYLIVEGKLMGPWVQEFETCWRSIVDKTPACAIQIDLVSVSFIDDAGRALLRKMCQQGVRFVTTGLLIKAIVNEIESDLKNEDQG